MKLLLSAIGALLIAAGPAAAQQAHQDHHGHAPQAGAATQPNGVTTTPADGAMTQGAPEVFTATFPHPMRLTAVTVTTQGRETVNVPVAAAAPTTRVTARLPRLAAGNHVVNWTAEGPDGHRMTGAVRFMVH